MKNAEKYKKHIRKRLLALILTFTFVCLSVTVIFVTADTSDTIDPNTITENGMTFDAKFLDTLRIVAPSLFDTVEGVDTINPDKVAACNGVIDVSDSGLTSLILIEL